MEMAVSQAALVLASFIGVLVLFRWARAPDSARKGLPTLHYSSTPYHLGVRRRLNPKTDTSDGEVESMTMPSFLERYVPSLFTGFKPTWWLSNGHAQTIYVGLGDFSKVDQIVYERTQIRLPDGGTLGLDITPPNKDALDLSDDTPIVVVNHGLTGGSHEPYVRSILSGACAPKYRGGLGYRAVVINFRGCAGVPITSPQWYSAGHTDDLRCGLLFISEKYPRAPLIGLGFSLGANVITRYLGEEGPRSRLRAGIVLACPWDVKANSYRLENEFLANKIYSKALGGNLLALFKSHIDDMQKLRKDTRLTPQLPKIFALKNPSLMDMDHLFTSVLGGSPPPFPFATTDKYYEWAASHHALRHIRVPFLAINSADDPVVGYNPIDEARHSLSCALAITEHGGHLGWFEGSPNPFRRAPPDRWIRRPVLEFIRATAEDLVLDPSIGPLPLGEDRVNRSGFVLEVGKDLVGFKIVEEGEIIYGVNHIPSREAVTPGL